MTRPEIVRHPRARRLRLSVDPVSGQVRLTIPRRASAAAALAWAETQRGWIMAEQARIAPPRPIAPGTVIPLEGEDVVIDWQPDRARRIALDHDNAGTRLVCGGPIEGLAQRIERWLRRRALAILAAETTEYATRAGVAVSRVSIGDPRTRWGSCAGSGAIRYSWRLILAPAWVRRATVAHEVAHRLEMNHSPAFHAVHAGILGTDPRPARAWLRTHGTALHRIGLT